MKTLTAPGGRQPLPSLLEAVRACRICAGALPHSPRPVLQATSSARILIVGQAPGRRVHESGVPFDDPSGERLRAWMGLTREQFYDPELVAIVPMSFCYPGTGRSGDLPPRVECAPAWRTQLLAQLTNVQLTLVVGRYALAWHLGTHGEGVTRAVAAWRDHWPATVPMPHPSPRNRAWLVTNPWFESDVIPALQLRVQDLLHGR
ncbi:MAG: uracil-DNA glycosylase family protein [Gemmatimonadota bacterium]